MERRKKAVVPRANCFYTHTKEKRANLVYPGRRATVNQAGTTAAVRASLAPTAAVRASLAPANSSHL